MKCLSARAARQQAWLAADRAKRIEAQGEWKLLHSHFDGETYEPEHDQARLSTQLLRVQRLMADRQWRTLSTIAHLVSGTEASVSARLRDLRKTRFGGWTVERRRVDGGLFEYRMLARPSVEVISNPLLGSDG